MHYLHPYTKDAPQQPPPQPPPQLPALLPAHEHALHDPNLATTVAAVIGALQVQGLIAPPSSGISSFLPSGASGSSWPGSSAKKNNSPPQWKHLEAAYDSFNEQEENLWTSKRVMETYTKATGELDFSRMAAEWNQEVTQQVVHTSVRRVKESTLRKKDEDDKRKESIRQAFPPNHQHVRNSWKGVSHFTQAAGDPTPPVLPTLQQQISAAPAVSAQAAAAALEAVAGNSQSCKKCLNHKITVPRKQHNCPYANCNCAKCQGTEKRRLQERNMKKQKRN